MSKPREVTIIKRYEERLRSQAGVMAAAHERITELERERDQLRHIVKFADARINTMLVECRAHPRSR